MGYITIPRKLADVNDFPPECVLCGENEGTIRKNRYFLYSAYLSLLTAAIYFPLASFLSFVSVGTILDVLSGLGLKSGMLEYVLNKIGNILFLVLIPFFIVRKQLQRVEFRFCQKCYDSAAGGKFLRIIAKIFIVCISAVTVLAFIFEGTVKGLVFLFGAYIWYKVLLYFLPEGRGIHCRKMTSSTLELSIPGSKYGVLYHNFILDKNNEQNICSKCGEENTSESRFCEKCGEPL